MPEIFTYLYGDTPPAPMIVNIETNGPLLADQEWISDVLFTSGHTQIVGSVYADQDGIIFIEQDDGGGTWDISTSYTITRDDGKGFKEDLLLPRVRIRYENGNQNQTIFRLRGYLR